MAHTHKDSTKMAFFGIDDRKGVPSLLLTARMAYAQTSRPWLMQGSDYANNVHDMTTSSSVISRDDDSTSITGDQASPSACRHNSLDNYTRFEQYKQNCNQNSSFSSVNDGNIRTLSERILALLLIRIIALLSVRNQQQQQLNQSSQNQHRSQRHNQHTRQHHRSFGDISTTTICRELFREHQEIVDRERKNRRNSNTNLKDSYDDDGDHEKCRKEETILQWPLELTQEVIEQLRDYVTTIMKAYRRVSYHNCQHAYHVFVSTNKLLDLVLCRSHRNEKNTTTKHDGDNISHDYVDQDKKSSFSSHQQQNQCHHQNSDEVTDDNDSKKLPRPTFGLGNDPLLVFAVLFSALVHDVDHTGTNNIFLVKEGHPLAILYNDQSVAEQRSVAVAFSLLLGTGRVGNRFHALRNVLFATEVDENPILSHRCKEYRRFRRTVIDLVLCTDIGSSERIQIAKSRYKEAFDEKERTAVFTRRQEHYYGCETVDQKLERIGLQREANLASKSRNDDATIRDGNKEQFGFRRGVNYNCNNNGNNSRTAVMDLTKRNESNQNSNQFASPIEVTDMSTQIIQTGESLRAGLLMEYNSSSTSGEEEDDDSINHDCDASPYTPSVNFSSELRSEDTTKQPRSFSTPFISQSMRSKSDIFPRRNSLYSKCFVRGHSVKLGIRTALDLSGNTIQTFSSRKRVKGVASFRNFATSSGEIENPNRGSSSRRVGPSTGSNVSGRNGLEIKKDGYTERNNRERLSSNSNENGEKDIHCKNPDRKEAEELGKSESDLLLSELPYDPDEPDELKAQVVLEQLLRAADVSASGLQCWENFLTWSRRLFCECKVSFVADRGDDPAARWFENQMSFFNSYLLPVTKRLMDMDIFDEDISETFTQNLENIMRKWVVEGPNVTEKLTLEWNNRQRKILHSRNSFE